MKLDTEVIVVGSGFSGIGIGIALKKDKFDFLILEKAHTLGGTWRDNTYPGIAVDIASFTYSFSFAQNPDWSRVFAPGHELAEYARKLSVDYELEAHMHFGKTVESAVYNEKQKYWQVNLADGSQLTARFFITATGALTQPKLPQIPGWESFAGKVIHTARWDHTADLRNKRVGIIGTGATSVQLAPALAPITSHLTVFQRTPIWIFPKPDAEISHEIRELFKLFPVLQWFMRGISSSITEAVMVLGVIYNRQFPWLTKALEQICRNHLNSQVADASLRDKLTPDYGFGCKRPSFSNEYLKTFNHENVSLETNGIREVVKEGIITNSGELVELDIIIAATGFKVFEFGNLPPFEVAGRNELELGQFFEENRFQAYEGTSVPGFPNLFMMVGPYSAAGASWFQMIEVQTRHIMRCLNEARRRKMNEIEVSQIAHKKYFEDILQRQKNTVFYNSNCASANSYYFDKHGDAPFLRPMPYLESVLHSRFFNLNDYRYTS